MKPESHRKSFAKSLLWRGIGIVVLAFVTFIFTRSLIQTGLITFLHHFTFIFIYYFHERVWFRIHRVQGKKRRVLRAFTYEIILGHCVLGLISFIVTGSWTKVTLITITYIENKLWMYLVYDWIWEHF
ncbi:hypothetical protein ES702_01395 [subsurface metagenome]